MSTHATPSQDLQEPVAKDINIPRGLHELFRSRWSPRAFEDRPVSNSDLELILEAGRWAASSNNEQPWRFIVARRSDKAVYDKLLEVLVPFNQEWAKTAPVLILTVAKRDFSAKETPNRHSMHDTGAALAHIMLEATALGLHAHGMAGFDSEKARKAFGIPDGYEPAAAVAIGYLGSPDSLPDRLRERELAPSARKPLAELAFGEKWGEPLKF